MSSGSAPPLGVTRTTADGTAAPEALLRVGGALVGGFALAASFPPYDLAFLGPIAIAVLTLCWHGARLRTGLLAGLAAGLSFFGVLVGWVGVVGLDAWAILTLYCALWIALTGAGVAATSRWRAWPLVVPLIWVAQEALRDRYPFGGFSWGRLAFGQTDTWLTPYAALAGAPAVTFVTALVGALLAWAVLRVRRTPVGGLGAVLLAGALVVGGRLVPLPDDAQGAPDTATVAVVQGARSAVGLGRGDPGAVLQGHVEQTGRLAAEVAAGRVPQPDLVVWPESSTDRDPYADPQVAAQIQRAVDLVGAPVLVGATLSDPRSADHVLNSGIVWGPTGSAAPGPGQVYVKQHPVPFGEYVPWRSLLVPIFGQLALVPRDFTAGTTTGILRLGDVVVGNLICFEVADDELVRRAVTGQGGPADLDGAGGRMITVQTNNATYARTGQPEQQLAITRLRAIEHGRTIAVAATTGITAVVGPRGEVEALPELDPGYVVATVPLRDSLTLADRVGAWPEWIATALAALILLGGVLTRGRRSRDVRSSSQPTAAPPTTQESPP